MHHIIIQYAADKRQVPTSARLRAWAKKMLVNQSGVLEVTIRIVDEDEMSALNATYRHKQGPTNVLSFPFSMPKNVPFHTVILGDIVICAPVVKQEATAQGKSLEAHWAHMVVHGMLHLLGYDHETDAEASIMEPLEIQFMQSLGFANPYTA